VHFPEHALDAGRFGSLGNENRFIVESEREVTKNDL